MAQVNTIVPIGGAVDIKETKDGEYTVKQVAVASDLPKVVNGGDRIEIEFSIGPLKVVGYVIPSTLEIGVEIYMFGSKIGTFYGNLAQGLVITIDLFLEKGKLRFYLDGKDVMLEIKLSGLFDYSKTVKLITI